MESHKTKVSAMDIASYWNGETESERKHREEANFKSYEAALPDLISVDSVAAMGKAAAHGAAKGPGHAIMSAFGFLGNKNPIGKKAKAKEHYIWLLDNIAHQQQKPNTGDNSWEAEYVACFFEKGREDITKYVSSVVDAIGIDGKVGITDESRQLIATRLGPFIDGVAPSRILPITIPCNAGPPHKRNLGPSDQNGISSQILLTGGDASAAGTTVSYTTDPEEKDCPQAIGKTRFFSPEGWAILSDIDDTIKITQTPSPAGILKTTFAEPAKTTAGMPEFYKILDEQFEKPAWVYLSASPYNLYPFLHQFVVENYIPGTLILRDVSWMTIAGLLSSLTVNTQGYKVDRMEKVHTWLPQRKFICIGDSTQTDPEAYATMYRQYPEWVKAIYIRKVVDAPFMTEKNRDERFQEAFKDVPAHIWKVFVEPQELADHVKHLAGQAHLGLAGAIQAW